MSTFRYTCKGLFNAQEWRGVWYGEDTVRDISGQLPVVDAIFAVYSTLFTGTISDQCSMYAMDVKQVDVPGTPSVEYVATGGTITGNQVLTPTATQICFLASLRSLTAPPNRVRKYLAGFMGGQLETSGVWSAATIAAVAIFITDIIGVGTGLAGLEFPLSTKLDTNGVVIAQNVVTEGFPRTIPATQRRRRLGVGI